MPVTVVTTGGGGAGDDGEAATPGGQGGVTLRTLPSSNSLIFDIHNRTMSSNFSMNDLSPSPSFSARPSQSDFSSTPWDTAMSKELSRQLKTMVRFLAATPHLVDGAGSPATHNFRRD